MGEKFNFTRVEITGGRCFRLTDHFSTPQNYFAPCAVTNRRHSVSIESRQQKSNWLFLKFGKAK